VTSVSPWSMAVASLVSSENVTASASFVLGGVGGRGFHSSTSQLNLSRFRHKIHPDTP